MSVFIYLEGAFEDARGEETWVEDSGASSRHRWMGSKAQGRGEHPREEEWHRHIDEFR